MLICLADWWDIIAGAIIGIMMALSAYRMVYASIWNYKYNHIPLHPQALTRGMATREPVWTRKAGWGVAPAPVPVAPVHPANGARMV